MTKSSLSSSFVLRVFSGDKLETIKLQNLKTGETVAFSNWEDLTKYLKTKGSSKGLR